MKCNQAIKQISENQYCGDARIRFKLPLKDEDYNKRYFKMKK